MGQAQSQRGLLQVQYNNNNNNSSSSSRGLYMEYLLERRLS